MCLIIKKPAGRHIGTDFLRHAWRHNAHGWGCFHAEQGQLVWQRGLQLDELIAHNKRLPLDAEVYLHLRRATHGAINHAMAHPHVVRPGLLLMHNGSIAQLVPSDPARSDTAELARLLRDMLHGLDDAQVTTLLRTEGFRRLMAPLVDGSMVILMDGRGPVHLGRAWHTIEAAQWDASMAGIEVSNVHTWVRHRTEAELA
jgi:predicted glutamine amidotransferase